jgi:hypothetical protein
VAGVLRSVIPQLDLRSWRTVDYRLKALPDHRLILALHQRGLPGLVTCDEEMLELPEVLAVVKQVAFHLVVCTRTGHDAVAAMGSSYTTCRTSPGATSHAGPRSGG